MSSMCIQVFIFAMALIFTSCHSASIVTPFSYANSAVGTTHENVVRSFGGTVSHYSKAVDTPFSSVRKSDTRVNNNVYTPAIAKTVTNAAAAAPTTIYATHSAPAPTVYAAASPAHAVYETRTSPVGAVVTHYSPAATVAHVTFDGFGAHYFY